MSALPAVSPQFVLAFVTAALATVKVFAVGAVGYYAVVRRWISAEGLTSISALVANLALPCLIFHRFATQFDPQTFPGWWKLALMGAVIQVFVVLFGKLIGKRHKSDETTMLVGYQNAGFFVLPMLQALLPASQFDKAALMLFVFIIFFNASLWPMGEWVLLHKRRVNLCAIALSPPTFATLLSLLLFGLLHNTVHSLDTSWPAQILIGNKQSPGILSILGDLTVPLATLVIGGSIARTAAGGVSNVTGKRVSLEIAFWKLVFVPLCGFLLMHYWPNSGLEHDRNLRLLLMLEFAAPSSINVAVFCQQHGYPMRIIPTASLVCYALCIVTVPFWVALVL